VAEVAGLTASVQELRLRPKPELQQKNRTRFVEANAPNADRIYHFLPAETLDGEAI
jgi:hypothetical protein